jgi:hypothetical protein
MGPRDATGCFAVPLGRAWVRRLPSEVWKTRIRTDVAWCSPGLQVLPTATRPSVTLAAARKTIPMPRPIPEKRPLGA